MQVRELVAAGAIHRHAVIDLTSSPMAMFGTIGILAARPVALDQCALDPRWHLQAIAVTQALRVGTPESPDLACEAGIRDRSCCEERRNDPVVAHEYADGLEVVDLPVVEDGRHVPSRFRADDHLRSSPLPSRIGPPPLDDTVRAYRASWPAVWGSTRTGVGVVNHQRCSGLRGVRVRAHNSGPWSGDMPNSGVIVVVGVRLQ